MLKEETPDERKQQWEAHLSDAQPYLRAARLALSRFDQIGKDYASNGAGIVDSALAGGLEELATAIDHLEEARKAMVSEMLAETVLTGASIARLAHVSRSTLYKWGGIGAKDGDGPAPLKRGEA